MRKCDHAVTSEVEIIYLKKWEKEEKQMKTLWTKNIAA